MTTASYLSDRRDQKTWRQLSRQTAAEEVWRREPFKPASITTATASVVDPREAPAMYRKFCVNCHGEHGEGARQGTLTFPPLLDVSSKPRRTADDIVGLLKDPAAYGLQPPMRSFADKLTEQQMREIGEWVVKLKR
jgi:mono/diheme cytochrome c family protein